MNHLTVENQVARLINTYKITLSLKDKCQSWDSQTRMSDVYHYTQKMLTAVPSQYKFVLYPEIGPNGHRIHFHGTVHDFREEGFYELQIALTGFLRRLDEGVKIEQFKPYPIDLDEDLENNLQPKVDYLMEHLEGWHKYCTKDIAMETVCERRNLKYPMIIH